MNKKTDVQDFEEIDRLIHDEVGQALKKFRAGDFEGRVRRRIVAEPGPAKGIAFLAKIAVPVAAILVLAISAAVYIFNPSRSSLPAPIDPGDFAAVLSRFPSFSRPLSELPSRAAAEAVLSEAGRAFTSVLASAGGADQGERGSEEASPIRTAPPRAARLTMRERMEILFRDKVIERVLLSFAHIAKGGLT
jgi:hypothetical protein